MQTGNTYKKQQLVDYLHSQLTKRGFVSEGYEFIGLPKKENITNWLTFGHIKGVNIDVILCTFTTDEKYDSEEANYTRAAIITQNNKTITTIKF